MGIFPGMLAERNFRIVLVSPVNGVGDKQPSKIDKMVLYSGKQLEIRF